MCGVEISLPKQPTSEYPASSHIISTMEGRPLLILSCSDSSLRITIVANGSTRYYAGYDRRDAPRAADGGNVNGALVVHDVRRALGGSCLRSALLGGPGTSRIWAKTRDHFWRRLGKLFVVCSSLGKLIVSCSRLAKLGRFAKKSLWDRHRPPWWTAILAAVLRKHKIRAFLRLVDTIALQEREFESNPIRKAQDKITHNNQP